MSLRRNPVPAFLLAAAIVGVAFAATDRDAVRAKVAAVDTARYDADTVVVLEQTNVTVRPNGIGVAEMQRVVKIGREGGIRGESVQRFSFDPTTNRLTPVAVRVYRKDGGIDEVDLAKAAVQPEPQWGIYWGSHQLMIGVPRLEVGDAVETIVVKTGFNVAYLAEGPVKQHGPEARAASEAGHRRDAGAAEAGATEAGAAEAGAAEPVATEAGAAEAGAAEAGAAEAGATEAGATNANAVVADSDDFDIDPPMPGHWYDEVEFWSGVPVVERSYSVRLPKDKPLQYAVYNGEVRSAVTFEGEHVVYSFEKRDIPVYKGEPSAASPRDTQCKLVLATLGDWFEKSRWFYKVNEPSFAVDDDIRAKTAEIIANCKTDEEKITALNHWVAENIRYVGTSRGVCEGYTTHAVKETFRDRGGVCKDKAGLLVAMLRCAGFDSYIVMTQAGTDVARVPADQFNHAVTCIRNPDGSFRLLDPTWMPRSRENWSSAEQLQYVVYGVPEGADLAISPPSGPEENVITCNAESRLDGAGALRTRIRWVAIGAPETALRRALHGRHSNDRPKWFHEVAQRLGALTNVSNLKAMDPVDFSGPLTAEFEAHAAGYALGQAERRYFRLPLLRRLMYDTIGDVDAAASTEKRTLPIRMRSTRRMEFVESVTLPAGWQVATLPPERFIDGPAASIRFRAAQAGGKVEYTCVVDLKKRTVPPDEYANFKQVIDAMKDVCDAYVVCSVEAGRAQK